MRKRLEDCDDRERRCCRSRRWYVELVRLATEFRRVLFKSDEHRRTRETVVQRPRARVPKRGAYRALWGPGDRIPTRHCKAPVSAALVGESGHMQPWGCISRVDPIE